VSLWGGDATFQNLDLRLGVLNEQFDLPFTFISGHIHELLIHVPWVKIISEPIVITINTIECILKMKDGSETEDDGNLQYKSAVESLNEDTPSSYMKSIVTKVVNNITINCNNLILKFVEEDIVLSVNIRFLSMQTVNEDWKPTFTDVNATDMILRKVMTIEDLTLCLDRMDSSGKIDIYQDPVVYRCSMTIRWIMNYQMNTMKRISITRFDLHCENMEFSMTEQQIPMLLRLITLLMESSRAQHGNIIDNRKLSTTTDDNEKLDDDNNSNLILAPINSNNNNQAWGSWAWNTFTSIVPVDWSNDSIDQSTDCMKQTLNFGIYIDNATLTFKTIDNTKEETFGHKNFKVRYRPFVTLNLSNVVGSIIIQGMTFSAIEIGLGYVCLIPRGYCSCDYPEVKSNVNSKPYICAGTINKCDDYLKNSLFDSNSDENNGKISDYQQYITDHLSNDNEKSNNLLKKSLALFIEYIHYVDVPEEMTEEELFQFNGNFEFSNFQEHDIKRYFIGDLNIRVCSGMLHRMSAIINTIQTNLGSCILQKTELTVDELPPVTVEEFESLNDYIPITKITLNIIKLSIDIQISDHYREKRKFRVDETKNLRINMPNYPKLIVEVDEISCEISAPLYAFRLAACASKQENLPETMLERCYKIIKMNIIGFTTQLNLTETSHMILIMPCAIYLSTMTLLYPQYWQDLHITRVYHDFKMDSLTLTSTKAKLMIVYAIITSNFLSTTNIINSLLSSSLYYDACNEINPVYLELSFESIIYTNTETSKMISKKLSIGSLQVFALNDVSQAFVLSGPEYLTGRNNDEKLITAQLHYPSDFTNSMINNLPITIFKISETRASIDPLFLDWLSYQSINYDLNPIKISSECHGTEETSSDTSTRKKFPSLHENVHSPSDKERKWNALAWIQLPENRCDDNENKSMKNTNILQKFINWRPWWKQLILNGFIEPMVIYIPTLTMDGVGVDGIEQSKDRSLIDNDLLNIFVIKTSKTIIRSTSWNDQLAIDINNTNFFKLSTKILNKSNHFPWVINLTDFHCYTIKQNEILNFFIMDSLNATIDATIKPHINTNVDNSSNTFGFCTYIDTSPIIISICKQQMELIEQLYRNIGIIVDKFIQSSDKESVIIINNEQEGFVSLQERVPFSPTQILCTDTDTTSTASTSRPDVEVEIDGNVNVTSWIQWTIAKIAVKLYANDNLLTKMEYRMIMEMEDIITSIDWQSVYLQIKNKITTATIFHYKRSINNNIWRLGDCTGLIMSSGDEIDFFDFNKTTESDFLNITITRAKSSNVYTKWHVIIPVNSMENQRHECFIMKTDDITIVPQAKNPVCRVILRQDIYQLAAQANILNIPGSAVEDRQYQININNATFYTTTLKNYGINMTKRKTQSLYTMNENPALEWNKLESDDTTQQSSTFMIPHFNLCCIIAPSIIFKSNIIVCGSAVEITLLTNIEVRLNSGQIKLLSVLNNQFQQFNNDIVKKKSSSSPSIQVKKELSSIVVKSINDMEMKSIRESTQDSGVDVDTSSIEAGLRVQSTNNKITIPSFEYLINGGKISLIIYEITEIGEYYSLICMTINQFNVYFSQLNSMETLRINCFDYCLALGDENCKMENTVQVEDLNKFIIETKNGDPHPKTGIPPSFLEFKWENNDGKSKIFIEMGRPTKINLSLMTIDQLNSIKYKLMNCLMENWTTNSTASSTTFHDWIIKDKKIDVPEINLRTKQIVLSFKGNCGDEFVGSLAEFDANLSCKSRKLHKNIAIKSLMLTTISNNENNKIKPLLKPLSGHFVINIVWESWQDIDDMPLIRIQAFSDGIYLNIDPDQIKLLENILNDFSTLRDKFFNNKNENSNIKSTSSSTEQYYQDDLKAGAFHFADGTPDQLPLPYQVIFSELPHQIMSWRYPQPRILTQLSIIDVMFEIIDDLDVDLSKIICRIEYWNENLMEYQRFIEFNLTKIDNSTKLPNKFPTRAVACLWRAVITQMDNENVCPVSARDLAGCIRIDSYFNSSLIPTLEITANIEIIKLSLFNNIKLLKQLEINIQITIAGQINCLIMCKDLWIRFGPEVSHTITMSLDLWQMQLGNCDNCILLLTGIVVANDLNIPIRIGQFDSKDGLLLSSRSYDFYSWRHERNRKIIVGYERMGVWIWSQPFTIENCNNTKSLKFNFDSSDYQDYERIYLTIKSLSPTQKIIILSGRIIISNQLNDHFELKLVKSNVVTEDVIIISGHSRPPSLFVDDFGNNMAVRLRFANLPNCSWTGDIPLHSNTKCDQPWLVKVPTHEKGHFLSIWVRIVQENLNEHCRTLVILSPLYIIQSWLPMAVDIQVETPTLDTFFVTKINGGCQHEQMYCPGTFEHFHQIKFLPQTKITSVMSCLPLSYNSIDQSTFFKRPDKEDMDAILERLDTRNNNTIYPFILDDDVTFWTPVVDTSTSIHVRYRDAGLESSTLLLEIRPWCFILNSMGETINITTPSGDSLCKIPHRGIASPPKLEGIFNIEIETIDGNKFKSLPLQLAHSEWNRGFIMPQINGLVPMEGTIKTLIDCNGVNSIMLIINSTMYEDVRILRIICSHIVCNFTKHELIIAPIIVYNQLLNVEVPSVNDKCFNLSPCHSQRMGIPIIQWYNLNNSDPRNSSLFICICNGSDIENDQQKRWSCPVKVDQSIGRHCITIFNGAETIPAVLTIQKDHEITYITILEDNNPQLVIKNSCSFPIIVGQANATCDDIELDAPPFSWKCEIKNGELCHYTMKSFGNRIPDASIGNELTLSLILSSLLTEQNGGWKKIIELPPEPMIRFDQFVHDNNYGDVKIMVESRGHTIYIELEPKSQMELAVRDIRSRLMLEGSKLHSQNDHKSHHSKQNNSSTTVNAMESTWKNATNINLIKSSAENNGQKYLDKLLTVYFHEINLILTQDTNEKNNNKKVEVAGFYLTNTIIYGISTPKTLSLRTFIGDLQFDNQMFNNGGFDFAVVLINQKPLGDDKKSIDWSSSLENTIAEIKKHSLITLELSWDIVDDKKSCRDVHIKLLPINIYIEDRFITQLLEYLTAILRPCILITRDDNKLSHNNDKTILKNKYVNIPMNILIDAKIMSSPLRLQRLIIEPISILLSVHTSVRLYVALDHSPLQFSVFDRGNLFTTPYRLGNALTMHYLSGAIFGAGWVVGSLEILGSPGSFAQALGVGLKDFIAMPFQGLLQGPWGFIVGITHGSASLMKNITAGTVNSVTKLASSVARNLDRLTLDEEHLQRQEESRRVRPQGMAQGLYQGLSGFGISLLAAVGGLAHHPLQHVWSGETTTRGLVTGVGLGLVGVVTKPLSGAAELVALTGQGLLHRTGWNSLPTSRHSSNSMITNKFINTLNRFTWKLMSYLTKKRDCIIHLINADYIVGDKIISVAIILTRYNLFIININEDKIERVFSLKELNYWNDSNDDKLTKLFYITSNSDKINNINVIEQPEMNHELRTRIEQYVFGSSNNIVTLASNISVDSEQTQLIESTAKKPMAFLLDTNERNYLMAIMKIVKRQNQGTDFTVL
ncbi:hypothetical protein PV326_003263, partial [Microctonus aethiopoides]